MTETLRAYITRRYQQHPAATVPLKDFAVGFIDSLPAKERAAWTRGRLVAELVRAGYVVGTLERVQHVARLAPRGGVWTERNGRLELVNA